MSFRLPVVAAVDAVVRDAALAHLDLLAKPRGALGRLESLAAQICAIQGTLRPTLARPAVLVFVGDHGLAKEGVSAYPREVTAQMVKNFLAGGAAISVLSREFGAVLRVVDAGVDADLEPGAGLIDAKIARGTANVLQGPAMSMAQCELAVSRGAAIAIAECEAGADVLVLGEMGIGNTAIASLLMHRLTGAELADCVGRGTGLDDQGLAAKRSILTRVMSLRPDSRADPLRLLADTGGFELAMLVGAALGGASCRRVVLVDGFATTVAVALAAQLQPQLLQYCVFGHVSAEHAHRSLLRTLGVSPVLDLELRLGEASGAALALPLLRAAVRLIAEMATLSGAGVSDRGS